MAVYRVLINGSNFWLTVDGKPTRMGFYLTRFVHAESDEQAEEAAIRALRDHPKLQTLHNDPSDHPVIRAEELIIPRKWTRSIRS